MEILQAEVEKELRLVNSIIREAISHGGDLGGSYSTNGENLNNVIMAYLRARNLDNQYTTDATVYGDYSEPTIGRIPDGGEGFIYLDD